ncbi:MAG: hypothetical protein ICV64_04800 [Thermoleophilia bacterium]|nr:hypothetical protein [Thermoleophilia bacterium]
MIDRLVETPRPIPSRLVPTLGGGTVVALALPVFAVASWPLRGWLLGATLWLAAQALALLLARLPLGADRPATAGVVGIGTMFRPIAVMVVAIAVAASNPALGVAAALVYALAYSVELPLSLALYFAGRAE